MSNNNRNKFYVTMKGMADNEPPEEEFEDAVILELARLLEEDEAQMTTVVEKRVKEVKLAAGILRQIVDGSRLWIDCRVHDPFPSIGCVSIIGEDITIENMVMFRRVVALASNMDIYVDVNGTIHIDFTFHGLMRR